MTIRPVPGVLAVLLMGLLSAVRADEPAIAILAGHMIDTLAGRMMRPEVIVVHDGQVRLRSTRGSTLAGAITPVTGMGVDLGRGPAEGVTVYESPRAMSREVGIDSVAYREVAAFV